MNREIGLHPQSPQIRPHFAHRAESAGNGPTTLLIEVPEIRPLPRPAARPSREATERIRRWHIAEPPRRRRRLRREVRVAGSVFLAVVSVMTAGMLLRDAGDHDGPRPVARHRPPVVSLSIEPAALATPQLPVILPGYLLPADSVEEAGHAGG